MDTHQPTPIGRLALDTLRTAAIGVPILCALLFLPAGTLVWWQGWLFVFVFVASTNAIGIYLALNDPALLERRKRFGPAAEQRPAQRIVIALCIVGFLGVIVMAGLDHRFGWSSVPATVALVGDALVALGLFLDLIVLRENSFGGSTIELSQDQTVIATGPYAVVRHPMYVGALVMAAGVPLALASWWALLVVALCVPLIVWRILDEEAMLRSDLRGYADYAARVRYRLLPGVW